MEFQQLEMFVAVVEEGSVRRAAERVFRTAPAISIALKKLDEEIGAPLISRSERNLLELTASGQLLYDYATKILNLKREALAGLQNLSQCRIGTVRVGTNESTSLYLLPQLTHAFQETHPELKIEVMDDNSDKVIKALKDGRLDVALVALTSDEPALNRHLIMRDEIVLIVNPNHRLVKRTRLDIGELANEVLITESSKSSSHEEVAHAFSESGTPFNVQVANVTIEGVKRMVAEGIGVGFVPLMCVQEEVARSELVAIRVMGVSHERELFLVHRHDELSPTAKAFVKVCLTASKVLQTFALPLSYTASGTAVTGITRGAKMFARTGKTP